MTRNERLAASFDGTFVVFMIGIRINNPLLVHSRVPSSRPDFRETQTGGIVGQVRQSNAR